MEIKEGDYLIKFIEAENTWKTFYNHKCIASTSKEIWDKHLDSTRDNVVAFNSLEAGQELLFTTIDITASMLTSLQKESAMIKDDDGHVVDEPTPVEKLGEPLNEKGQLIFEIGKTLEDMKNLPQNCAQVIVEAINNHLSNLVLKYAALEKASYQEEFDKLKSVVDQDLKNGFDCGDDLQRLEEIYRILRDEFK